MVTKVLERHLETFFSKECKRLGLANIKLHLKFSTGWPDRVVIINRKVIWVELKTPTGKLSARQEVVHQTLKDLKHIILVLRTKEEITNALESASVSTKRREVPNRKRLGTVMVGSGARENKYHIGVLEDSEESRGGE